MTFELFSRVALQTDIAEYGLRRGDIATIVDHHPVREGEDGYSLEVFNALGETIAVVVVSESQISPMARNEVLQIRVLEKAS
jgi:hypothetical protein